MDSAMRDLDQLRERGESAEGAGRKLALLGLAGLTTVGVVLALGVQVGTGSADDAQEQADPLARLTPESGLAAAAPLAPEEAAEAAAEPLEVDRVALTFPETLTDDERPEVAIALAAASAELRHPDPLPAGALPAGVVTALPPQQIEERLPAALPAALAAGSGGSIARAAPHDPMLLGALPAQPVGEGAPEGHDGEYTVQVISYDSPEGAHAFAAGLRARGHRAFVMRAEVDGHGTMYRVRIGPFESMSEANAYRRSFEESERMNTIVIRRR